MTEPNKWHRVGILMTFVALVLNLVALAIIAGNLPSNWHITMRHSDHPTQVDDALQRLDAEIDEFQGRIRFREAEISEVRARAARKADECRRGIGEEGTVEVDPEKRAAIEALAPGWDKVVAAVDIVQARRRALVAADAIPAGH